MADEFMYPGSKYFVWMHEAFETANRAEMHVYTLTGDDKCLAVDVSFHEGKKASVGASFTFNLSDGQIGAGYLGAW